MKGEINQAIAHYKNALALKYHKPDCLYNLGRFGGDRERNILN